MGHHQPAGSDVAGPPLRLSLACKPIACAARVAGTLDDPIPSKLNLVSNMDKYVGYPMWPDKVWLALCNTWQSS